jgi:MFS family permease
VSRDIGIFQSSITLGQLLGPPAGTLSVAYLGYTGAFLAAAAVLFVGLVLSQIYIGDMGCLPPKAVVDRGRRSINRRVLATWFLCLAAQIQLIFLPSILPDVFRGLALSQAAALGFSGPLITLYTLTAMLGTYIWSVLARKTGERKMIGLIFLGSIALQVLLMLPDHVVGYTAVRMAQTCLVAAVIPLALALFAGEASGFTMGFLYSSRFWGNAAGPMVATSVLAVSSVPILYLAIGGLSLVALLVFLAVAKSGAVPSEQSA